MEIIQDDKNKEMHVITGGGGYAGLRLAKALCDKGHNVTLFDVQVPIDTFPDSCKFVKVCKSENFISHSLLKRHFSTMEL